MGHTAELGVVELRLPALPSDEGEKQGGIPADAMALRHLADDPAPFLCKLLHIFLHRAAWTRLVCDRLGGSTGPKLVRLPNLSSLVFSSGTQVTNLEPIYDLPNLTVLASSPDLYNLYNQYRTQKDLRAARWR